MKKICLYLTTLALLSVLVAGCSKDKLDPTSVIKMPMVTENDLDQWLYDNYVKPYNISLEYRLVDSDVPLAYNLTPVRFDIAVSLAQAMLFLCIEPYDIVTGSKEFNRYAFPKFLNFVGSAAHNNTSSEILGTAEDGIKVILYRLNRWNTDLTGFSHNSLNPFGEGGFRGFTTVHHELGHILHQRRPFSPDFGAVSRGYYTGDEWTNNTNTLAVARSNGFVTRYASSSEREDFVELFATYIMTTEAWWDAMLESAGEFGAETITTKLNIVMLYMIGEWGIDMNELRDVLTERIAQLSTMNLNEFSL